jgi:serine/threonine protein kinase
LKGKVIITFSKNNLEECFLLCEPYLKILTPPLLFLRSIEQRDLIQGVVKLGKNEEEHKNLKRIELMLSNMCFHAVQVIATKNKMFLMTYPRPFLSFPPIKTLKDMFVPRVCRNFCSEGIIKSIVYQCITILDTLHKHNVNFTHNDLKAENIMIERCEAPILHYESRIYSKGVRVVLIDMESITGLIFPCTLKKSLSLTSQRDFGLDDSPWCSFTDFHLICMEILLACRTSFPSWGPNFAEFLDEYIPLNYFKTPYITCENRLSSLGKLTLGTSPLNKILSSQYFNSIRV